MEVHCRSWGTALLGGEDLRNLKHSRRLVCGWDGMRPEGRGSGRLVEERTHRSNEGLMTEKRIKTKLSELSKSRDKIQKSTKKYKKQK